ncbi:MAG TPA: hypothetical protein VK969_06175 [Acidimicrobiia bacterium]|nr:hypothetical protein [Acidimicrobiia bacterium]
MPIASRHVGLVALIAAAWLVIGNITHPVGSTEIYTEGVAFVEHTDAYWVINHVLLALAFTVIPWLAWAWGKRLTSTVGRTWGAFGVILAALGTVNSVLHMGIDGVAIPAFGEVLQAHGEAAVVGAETLLKIHLASITAWAILFWGGAQTTIGVAEVAEGSRRWLGWLMIVCGLLGFAFAGSIAVEGNLTSFTEGVLFRGSTVGFTVWFIWTAWRLARSEQTETSPAGVVKP